jgi:serine/threonine protein kinase
MFLQILDGIKFLHNNSIIHGNLNNNNIIVNPNNLKVTIIDFGLSIYL